MAIIQDRRGDVELHAVLTPAYFQNLVEHGRAERERINQALSVLEPGDMLRERAEFLGEHLDTLITRWQADAQKAALRFS